MEKINLKKFSDFRMDHIGQVWGGQTSGECWTKFENEAFTQAGGCDTHFKIDGTTTSSSSYSA